MEAEIGRAQAAQAEACWSAPMVEMNPILAQTVRPTRIAVGTVSARDGTPPGRSNITSWLRNCGQLSVTLWSSGKRCDVLILEGAGSPVEL